MRDSSPSFDHEYRKMIMHRDGTERIRMGSEMFESAKLMASASFSEELSPAEKRIKLFLRIYQNDFSATEQQKVIRSIRKVYNL